MGYFYAKKGREGANGLDTSTIIAVVAAISGIILGWSGRSRAIRQDDRQETQTVTALRSDTDYIKRGVDDIRLEQRVQGQRIDALSERVARLEESSKSAHHRIDEIKSRGA